MNMIVLISAALGTTVPCVLIWIADLDAASRRRRGSRA
jgi:hypothetical protein